MKISEKFIPGDQDVWLLFLDENLRLEEYLETLMLPFNVQLILALTDSSNRIWFKAPYRVSKKHPLRIQDVGHWSSEKGLNLSVISVAFMRNDMEGYFFTAGTIDVSFFF